MLLEQSRLPPGVNVYQQDPAYKSLRGVVAERTQGLLVVTGSGLSAQAGLPVWAQLRAALIGALRSKAAGLDVTGARRKAIEADQIEREPAPWVAFQRLKADLGKTTFEAVVREELAVADTTPIPAVFEALWRLPVEGVLTLNLDPLAKRAFPRVHGDKELRVHNGKEAARLQKVLHSGRRFLFHLHGTYDDADSWVFTNEDLRRLLRGQNYKQLLRTCLTTYTVLFVGVSADDIALGGPLAELAKLEVASRTHYWITDRRDLATDEWAESNNIRIIRYNSAGGRHSAVQEMLEDLASYVPEEVVSAAPLALKRGSTSSATPLAEPDVLAGLPSAVIREQLNAAASGVLASDVPPDYPAFTEFLQRYDEPIYRAWYTGAGPGASDLLGYQLQRVAARGAFGRVYDAVAPDGSRVAVKVLLEEIRGNSDLLHSFRRGVAAMRILEQRGVEGMVRYRDASEIPAFVVMDWVEGPNLATAKESRLIEDWQTILNVGLALIEIIMKAHALPERVLHRDIRPSNIMLSDYYVSPDDWQVLVLDFDLSWHRNVDEKSVVHGSSSLGYLAPEQLRKRRGESTRHAAVDVFGIGMTLAFLLRGQEPVANEHLFVDFADNLARAAGLIPGSAISSLPARFVRLVVSCTRDRQADRWDLPQVHREVQRLAAFASADPEQLDGDLLCEEIAAASETFTSYSWDLDRDLAEVRRRTGLQVRLQAEPDANRLLLVAQWGSAGDEDRGALPKYLAEAVPAAVAVLRRAGWIAEGSRERQSFEISASVDFAPLRTTVKRLAKGLDEALLNINPGANA